MTVPNNKINRHIIPQGKAVSDKIAGEPAKKANDNSCQNKKTTAYQKIGGRKFVAWASVTGLTYLGLCLGLVGESTWATVALTALGVFAGANAATKKFSR